MHEVLSSDVIRVSEKDLKVEEVLSSAYPYEQGLVKIILGEEGSLTANHYGQVLSYPKHAIKIEGYERLNQKLWYQCRDMAKYYSHRGPLSAHLFLSPKDSHSFPLHTDPDDVILIMLKGRKVIEVDGERIELVDTPVDSLRAGSAGAPIRVLYMPAGTPHRAINTEDSIMLSIGLDAYMVKKL